MKPKRPTRSIRSQNSARALNSKRLPWAIVLGVMCVVVAAALIAARQSSPRADVANASVRPEATAPPERQTMPARLETKKTVVAKTATTSAAATRPVSKAPAATLDSMPMPVVQNLSLVTITGCLEFDAETFRLKNPSGADAPKSRSWRSGFLTKGPSPVELVDATNALKLANYVGQRVAATGMLTKREMRARSLQRVAGSCS